MITTLNNSKLTLVFLTPGHTDLTKIKSFNLGLLNENQTSGLVYALKFLLFQILISTLPYIIESRIKLFVR